MPKLTKILLPFTILLIQSGCNFAVVNVATQDADVIKAGKSTRIEPTGLFKAPSRLDKVELYDTQTGELTVIQPKFNTNGLFWTPTQDLNSRYRIRYTTRERWNYSRDFLVDGALDSNSQKLTYPKFDSASRIDSLPSPGAKRRHIKANRTP